MTTYEDFSPASTNPGTIKQPIVLITQLMHATKSMHHIDDVFQWTANALLQQSGVGIVQIIAIEVDITHNKHIALRTSASRHLTQTQQVQLYQHYTPVIERVFYEKREVVTLPILNILAPLATDVLARQNIHHWLSYFMERNVLLPPATRAANNSPTQLRIIVSLFTEHSLQQNMLRVVRFILEQAIRIAIGQGLLLPLTSPLRATNVTAPIAKLNSGNLIPIRTQSEQMDQATNPFASVVIISDKKARQLYSLVDGKKNLALLSQEMQMSLKEMAVTLHILLQQKSVMLQALDGSVVEDNLFSKSFETTDF